MKRIRMIVMSLCAVAALSTARAGMLELRGGFGVNAANPDAFENRVNEINGGGLSASTFDNINADLFLDIPAFPIGVGLRQEWINQKQTSTNGDWKLDAGNTSVLIDWRIIDTLVYVGPIVSVGYPTAKVDFNSGSTHVSDHLSGKPSYGIAAEAGLKLSWFLIGAEAGYQSLKLKNIDSSSVKSEVDLSGFYGKAMVGLTFL